LAEQFLPHVIRAGDAPAESPDLEVALGQLVADSRATWPTVTVPTEIFLRHVAQRLPERGDPASAVRGLNGADLFLACACTHGDPVALALFDEHFLSPIVAYVSRSDALPDFTDEVKQALRTRLLVARDQILPAIAGYGGRGTLLTWLRMTAVHLAIDLRKALGPNASPDSEALLVIRSPVPDPELTYLKTQFAAEFEAAFRSTLAQLSTRERNVLRLHFLEGVDTDAIANIYTVSVRTVQRWIGGTRDRILDETRRRLGERLRLSATQLDGLIDLVQSQVDLSISKILGDP
jgi:RNA polymerase sigma-70 factor (ECF subfamily)